jgi:hypothetical protein
MNSNSCFNAPGSKRWSSTLASSLCRYDRKSAVFSASACLQCILGVALSTPILGSHEARRVADFCCWRLPLMMIDHRAEEPCGVMTALQFIESLIRSTPQLRGR